MTRVGEVEPQARYMLVRCRGKAPVSVDTSLVLCTKCLEFTLHIPSLLQLGRAAGLVLAQVLWAECWVSLPGWSRGEPESTSQLGPQVPLQENGAAGSLGP